MIETIAALLTSGGTGGLIGLVGSWLTKREERKSLEIKFKHEVAMADIRRQEFELEADHELAMADKEMQRAELEGDIAVQGAELEAFTSSLDESKKSYGIIIVDAIRGLMRPVITVYLLVVATLCTLKIGSLVGGLESLDPEMLSATYQSVINQMLFLTATSVTWWFGSRPSSKRGDK